MRNAWIAEVEKQALEKLNHDMQHLLLWGEYPLDTRLFNTCPKLKFDYFKQWLYSKDMDKKNLIKVMIKLKENEPNLNKGLRRRTY